MANYLLATAVCLGMTKAAFSEPLYYYESSVDKNMRTTLKTNSIECLKSAFTSFKEAIASEEKRVLAMQPVNGNKCNGRVEGNTRSSKNLEKNEQISVVIHCGGDSADLITFVKDSRKCKIILDGVRAVVASQGKK